MNFFLSNSTFGISLWTLLLSLLEITTVVLFFIGCVYYVKIAKKVGNKTSYILAFLAAGLSFIGGFPNALDKVFRTLFEIDLWFNSTWLFFFVGISYTMLFISALNLGKKAAAAATLLSAVPPFHKPMKYTTMMMASIGMIGFYVTMYIKAKKLIGKVALLYFVTFATTAFLVVFSAIGNFTTVWPNIIAQLVNSAGYAAMIAANKEYLKKL